MAEIPFPATANVVNFSPSLDERLQVNTSEWTGARKVSTLPGAQKWSAKFSPHQLLAAASRKEWRAFLIALRGQVNSFRLPVCQRQHEGANPVVASGANAGATLPLGGMPGSAKFLDAGDYLTVPLPSGHNRLVMLTADLIANSSGAGVAQFRPFLNEVPVAATSVESKDPFAQMALTQATNGWTEDRGAMGIAFSVEEAL